MVGSKTWKNGGFEENVLTEEWQNGDLVSSTSLVIPFEYPIDI